MVALLAVVVPAALPAQASAPVAAAPFRVVRTVGPGVVVDNGQTRKMLIYWQGRPRFPVTVLMTPRAGCGNAIVSCGAQKESLAKRQGNEPAAFYWACVSASPPVVMRYDVQLKATGGRKTPKFPFRWVCKG